jgi:hypothetical protein
MNRGFEIIVVCMAVSVSAEAQSGKSTASANSAEASSIIPAPSPMATVRPQKPGQVNAGGQESSTVAAKGLPGTPAYSPGSTSGYILSEIAAGLPRFNAPPKAANVVAAGTKADGRASPATPGTELMPAFVVRDDKLPDEEQILTYKGRAKIAMDKYLGPSDGLDRGVLNSFTLVQLWKKIPILGGLPFAGTPAFMTNEERAFDAGGANDTIPYPHPPPKAKDGSDDLK